MQQASRCRTTDGSLKKTILGNSKFRGKSATKRGLRLESTILTQIEADYKVKIEKCGVIIKGIYGASPDGLMDQMTIEIKCPAHEHTFKNYVNNGEISDKVKPQMYLQMHLVQKHLGMLCVASPDYEEDKKWFYHKLNYNEEKTKELLMAAYSYWMDNIFPVFK